MNSISNNDSKYSKYNKYSKQHITTITMIVARSRGGLPRRRPGPCPGRGTAVFLFNRCFSFRLSFSSSVFFCEHSLICMYIYIYIHHLIISFKLYKLFSCHVLSFYSFSGRGPSAPRPRRPASRRRRPNHNINKHSINT